MRLFAMRLLLLCVTLATACGGAALRSARLQPSAAAAIPPVESSLFARDPGGQLSEEALQRLLASPIEVDLPARVGVLPIVTAADWRGPSPDWEHVPAGLAAFAGALRGAEPFTAVTEMLPIPSGALGMEALREAAARYALRYILLYREGVRERQRVNGVAAGYATLVGMLFLPGQTLEVEGYLEASLFDVKTGLLLFTVRRGVTGRRTSNLWQTGRKLEALHTQVTARFAPDLARDVRGDIARIIHEPTEPDGRGASSRRSDEGAGSPPETEERRPAAPQIGRQATEAHGLSGLTRLLP